MPLITRLRHHGFAWQALTRIILKVSHDCGKYTLVAILQSVFYFVILMGPPFVTKNSHRHPNLITMKGIAELFVFGPASLQWWNSRLSGHLRPIHRGQPTKLPTKVATKVANQGGNSNPPKKNEVTTNLQGCNGASQNVFRRFCFALTIQNGNPFLLSLLMSF